MVLLYSCNISTNQNSQEKTPEKNQKNSDTKYLEFNGEKVDLRNYVIEYEMFDSSSSSLGLVYVKHLNDSIFTDLLILEKNANKIKYYINNHIFHKIDGIDEEIREDGFYGYQFLMKKDNYFTLSCFFNNGKNVGDDITILWKYENRIFETLKTP